MTSKEAVSTLRLAFPRGADLPPTTVRLYEEHLADIEQRLLADTVREIIATAKFFPTIAEMRHTAASLAHLLPISAEEALVVVQAADVREDIYRRDGIYAYTERYWRFPKEIPASTMQAIYAALEQCGDMVRSDNEARFGWETGFKAVYRTAAAERSCLALKDLSHAHLPLPDCVPLPAKQLQLPGPGDSLSVPERKLLEDLGFQVPTDSMRALIARPAGAASLTDQECTDICQHLLVLDPACGPMPRTSQGQRVAAEFYNALMHKRQQRDEVEREEREYE